MSSTIGQLVDRIFREYLEPNDDVQSFSILRLGLDADSSDTTVNYSNSFLTSEEEDSLEPGAVIEINQELMLVTSLSTSAEQLTVKRAWKGTSLSSHSVDDIIRINPVFTRKAIFSSVSDQIKNLYPTLFAVETLELVSGTGYRLLGTYGTDGDTYNYIVAPLKALSQYTDWSSGSDQTGLTYKGVAVELIDLPNPFTWTDDTQTERTKTYTSGPNVVHAIQFQGIAAGHTVYVTFKKKFVEPTSEATTLTSVGLETEYEPIVMTGVVAQIIAGRDIPTATIENITQGVALQSYPVGSSNTIRNSLLQYQQILIQQARTNLRSKYPEPVQLNSILYPT
tara:strand:- start:297 stop:1310 length:1014 start_codon:yes stop_codon:yes gene_type:complete